MKMAQCHWDSHGGKKKVEMFFFLTLVSVAVGQNLGSCDLR